MNIDDIRTSGDVSYYIFMVSTHLNIVGITSIKSVILHTVSSCNVYRPKYEGRRLGDLTLITHTCKWCANPNCIGSNNVCDCTWSSTDNGCTLLIPSNPNPPTNTYTYPHIHTHAHTRTFCLTWNLASILIAIDAMRSCKRNMTQEWRFNLKK